MPDDAMKIDAKKETAKIVAFVRDELEDSGAKGVVVGLSGGVDSSVVGALCVRALGKTRVLGLLMPSEHTPKADVKDAKALSGVWGIRTVNIPISTLVGEFEAEAKVEGTKLARANVQARVRMALLYYYANTMEYLVAGTGDRSEIEIGFYTKWGDGGVDFLPIAHLFKTQVRELAAFLGLPERVAEKPASPQLWKGHRAVDEIPADYEKLDTVLQGLFDLGLKPPEAAARAGTGSRVAEKALDMHRKSAHKRAMPPSLA